MGTRRRALGTTTLAVVVIALATTGLSAAMVVQQDAADAVDTAFDAHDGPDLVVTTSIDAVDKVQSTLAADHRVAEVAPPRRIVDARAAIDGDPIALTVNGIDDPGAANTLNAPVLTGGRLPTIPSEVAIDTAAAQHTGLSLGDAITIRTPSAEQVFRVVGLAYDFTDCFYPTCAPARAWTLDQVIPTLDPNPRVLLAVGLTDPLLADAVGRRLARTSGGATVAFNTWLDTRGDLLAESDFFGAFLAAFGVLALVASMVVIAGTITARAWSRRRALAQLRSLGCTRSQIAVTLLVEHALIGLVGSGIGNFAAALLAPRLRIGALGALDDTTAGLSPATACVSAVIALTVCLLATVLPAVRAGRRDVVVGLGAAPECSGHGSGIGRLLAWVPLPVSADLGARASFTRPLRTALATVAVALAVSTTVIVASINQTMDDLLAHPALTGKPADATIAPPPGTSLAQATRLLDRTPEIAAWFSIADTTATVARRSVHVRAIGGDPHATGYEIGRGERLIEPGQAIAGYGLLDAAGWHIGQTLHLDLGGRTVDVTLVGWYREIEDSGEVLQIRMEDLHRISTSPVRLAVVGTTGTTPRQVGAALTRSFGRAATVEVNGNDAEHLAPFRYALATMAALIGAVALANMIAVAIITSRERSRRTGTLRALGMTRRSCFAEAIASAAPSIAAALAIGVPLGWLGARKIGDALTARLGAGPGLSQAPPATRLATIVAIVALSSAVTAAAAARPVIRRPIPDLLQDPS
ncbi:MAG: FtsX-like permease family protein [Acidimicrobiia bacterium]